jgi:hypothetical protein
MRCRVFAFQRLDELPQQFAPRNLRQTSNPAEFRDTPAEKSDFFSETVNRRTAAPRLTIRTLIDLVSFGIAAATTVGASFGVAFLLLADPKVEIVADLPIHQIDPEVSSQRSDTLPPSDSSASAPTESGSSSERAASSSDRVAAPPFLVPDWTSAIPPKYLRAHRHGREARMTGTTADRLNHQELAGLLAGRTMPPLSAMPSGRMRGGRHQEHGP